MDIKLSLDIDIPHNAPFNRKTLPAFGAAFDSLVNLAHQKWMQYALGTPLPDGSVITPRSGSYARSIATRQLGEFSFEIYSDSPYAISIEAGMPARDLHNLLSRSRRTRLSKKGKRYLIIPFRWGTPGTANGPRVGFGHNVMPQQVHDAWLSQKLGAASRIIGETTRISATGDVVPQKIYKWGGRLQQNDLTAMGIGTTFRGKTYKTHPMAGMVQMRRPGGKGGGKHSQYLTFRVLSEDSPGWRVPAVPGKWPAKTVGQEIERIGPEILRKAMEHDIAQILGAS